MIGLNWKDEDAAASDWLAQLGNPYRWSRWIAKGARPSTLACTALRKLFSSTPTGCVQYRHVGADDAEVWEREFLSRLPRGGLP